MDQPFGPPRDERLDKLQRQVDTNVTSIDKLHAIVAGMTGLKSDASMPDIALQGIRQGEYIRELWDNRKELEDIRRILREEFTFEIRRDLQEVRRVVKDLFSREGIEQYKSVLQAYKDESDIVKQNRTQQITLKYGILLAIIVAVISFVLGRYGAGHVV